LDRKAYLQWRSRLAKTRCLVYVGDNAGEIVLDRLLIQTIRERFETEVFFVHRSMATLNDATLEDARLAGLDRVATLRANGIQGPFPGTILKRCSPDIRDLLARSDLIISKGGGNFDTLDDQSAAIRCPLTFLLVSKCHPYYERFGVEPFRPILAIVPSDRSSNQI
jgi:uncharacterized protein with ATP-grasp and redox domains